MNISLNWLKYYVDIDVPVQELCDKMVMAGFEVESIVDLSQTMKNVVAGKIVKIEKHPDADKLQICQIDVGTGENIQIVTGADNIFEGAVVPVALHGSHLPNGVDIKKGKLRGVESNGMLCSGEELCLKEEDYKGAEVYGILILKDDTPVGADMREVLHLFDYVIDFKITANRPDCQSVLGVAREVSVVLGKPFHPPVPAYKTVGGDINDYIKIDVEDYDLCNRYYGRVVRNIRIKESPDWMKRCLKAAGMRPINNIVDITNFVMLETGQPMHAFDRRDIRDNHIIVRRAKDGEEITTLDGKEHKLTKEMLVIADEKAPSCLAGIMGGLDSEIKDDTTELFLESAKFRRDSVRRTARALGMRTESSARFERGLDIMNVEFAMERALQLINDLDAGDIIDGVIDKNQGLPSPKVLTVPAERINDLLGVEVPFEKMVEILNSLHIETSIDANNVLTCRVPSFRDDVEGRADLAEEVMRIYGYDHIVGTVMRGDVVQGKILPARQKENKLKALLCGQAMREISTYSFISSGAIDTLGLDENDSRRKCIRILNPLGDEYSCLRTQLITSMLTVISTNVSRKNESARLFEISKLFIPKELPLKEQPDEKPALCIGLYGKDEDFFTLKGAVEDVFALFGISPEYERSAEVYLHPGRQAKAVFEGNTVAVFGEIHPEISAKYGIDTRVYTAEISLDTLYSARKPQPVYTTLPKFPAVTRDLSLVCDRATPAAQLEKAIRSVKSGIIEDVKLFDVYEGDRISADKKSVAYSLVLRAPDRTLTDEECTDVVNKVIDALSKIGAVLRA